MKKFINWFAGIFEDQAGSASSKRITLFIALFFFWMIVKGSLEGKTVNQDVLFVTGGLILFCVGAITSEFLMKVYQDRKNGNNMSKE
jgi:multisubunit Na+/H+ antiporter MnhE subunit